MGHWIIAPVTFGVGGVTEKNTRDRPWSEFMRGGGRGARITETPEDPETIIGGGDTKEKLMRGIVPAWTTWTDVKKEGGGGKSIRPKPRRHVGVKEQRADTVINSANNALSAAILLRRVRASEAKDGAVRRKEVADSSVVKLFAIVSLKSKDGTTELSGDIGIEGSEGGESIGFATEEKRPHIMRKIIQYHQIV